MENFVIIYCHFWETVIFVGDIFRCRTRSSDSFMSVILRSACSMVCGGNAFLISTFPTKFGKTRAWPSAILVCSYHNLRCFHYIQQTDGLISAGTIELAGAPAPNFWQRGHEWQGAQRKFTGAPFKEFTALRVGNFCHSNVIPSYQRLLVYHCSCVI